MTLAALKFVDSTSYVLLPNLLRIGCRILLEVMGLNRLELFILRLATFTKAVVLRFARVTAKFLVGGGVFTTVVAEHQQKGWKPMPVVELAKFADESSVTARF